MSPLGSLARLTRREAECLVDSSPTLTLAWEA